MTEAYRLTILAGKPEGATGVDDTNFVDTMAATFGALPTCNLVRAATIVDVDSALSDAENAAAKVGLPLSVQIVGHGTSGQLLLGMTWIAEDIARAYPFYVIDTNPVALGFFRNHRHKLADLTLVGCHVGSIGDPDVEDDAVNGRSLTYVLSELLQCRVVAPVNYVATDDFKNGVYSGVVNGWTWSQPKGPPIWLDADHEPETHKGDRTALEIDRIDRTTLAVKKPGPLTVPRPIAVEATVIEKPRLKYATPELDVNVTTLGKARIVGDRRYLVTEDRQYAIENRDALSRNLRKCLWPS